MSDAQNPPPGEYAIIEFFGHTTMVGRVAEVERFGAKMLALEVIFGDTLLPAIFAGGASIYRFTPCSAAVAFARQPRQAYLLPPPVQAILPVGLLPAPSTADATAEDEESQGEHEDEGFPL